MQHHTVPANEVIWWANKIGKTMRSQDPLALLYLNFEIGEFEGVGEFLRTLKRDLAARMLFEDAFERALASRPLDIHGPPAFMKF